MRARNEPSSASQDMDIPMPAMSPAWRVAPRQRAAMDPGTRRLAIFAGVIGGALLLLIGVWSFSGHRHAGGVPVIEADSRPLRVKPVNPGGMQVEGANDSIMSGEADGKASMAPPPETPAPQALKAEEQPAAPPPPVAAPAPAPAQAPLALTPPEPPKPAAMTEAAPTRTAPLPTPPSAPARQEVTASIAKPAQAPSQLGMATTGVSMVQLAAVESEAAAKTEWQRLAHKYGDLLGGRTPTISKIEHGGKTFWRLRTGGFADVAQAEQFCARVKAKGGGCSVASF